MKKIKSKHPQNRIVYFVVVIFFMLQETSIELAIIGKDGIVQTICEQPLFGTIKDIAAVPWNEKFHAQTPRVC